jgi:hypothetical protein
VETSLIKDAQAHFDECTSTESAAARSLGVIAIEMMQNGIPHGKFVLTHPDRWSPEASNFLEVVSRATLKVIQNVSGPLIALSVCLACFLLASLFNACITHCYDSVYTLCWLGHY